MSEYEFLTLHIRIQTQYRNHLSICYYATVTSPANYILILVKPFSFAWYVIPSLKTVALALPATFFYSFDDEKYWKNWLCHVPYMLLDIILVWWRRPVVSSEALDLLHWVMRAVTYRRIAMAIKTASKVGVFVDCCLFACCHGGRRGNTEQVATQWRHPVASKVALNMLHQEMLSVLPRRTTVAIKMANNGGAFVCRCKYCHQP